MNRDSGSAELGQVNLILLTEEGAELPEDTRLRLLTLVENDRLGSGLAISLRDLELRGGGDLAGEEQAGHIKAIGIGLYQKLLASAVSKSRRQTEGSSPRATLTLGGRRHHTGGLRFKRRREA